MSTESKGLSSQADLLNKEGKAKQEQESGLKGTFVSVMLLGAFLVATWAIVFMIFISRQ